jgi:glycine oxidase
VPTASPACDVAIIGAGIVGCALARELAGHGAQVTLLDRAEPGQEASSAAAGMLGPQAESDGPGPLLHLGVASRALYPEVVAALREETGIDVEYDSGGIVYVARSDDEAAALERRRRWQVEAGYRVEPLDAAAVRALAPVVADDVGGGIYFPDDHRIDNVRLTAAYARAAVRGGVRLRSGCPVLGLRVSGGRVLGVELADGALAAGLIVNAAGAWAGRVPGMLVAPPVRPVRGQMTMLQVRAPGWPYAIYSRDVYLVPRRDGRVLAGSTYEDVGFDKRVTGGALAAILRSALVLAPSLSTATLRTSWAGLRPGTPDNLPILGRDPILDGLVHATGHYRNGILLAPVTARRLTALILEGVTAPDLAPFAPSRFTATAQPPSSRSR